MIIAILSVRNEEWIIEKTLTSLTQFCDKILVKLDNCDDKTEQICRKFKKVNCYKEDQMQSGNLISFKNRRQSLLEEARKFSKNPIIISVDADEIFSSEILDIKNQNMMQNLKPGEGYTCSFKELWFSVKYYRSEKKSEWAGRNLPCIWRDNNTDYPLGNRHENRIPPIKIIKNLSLPLVHFARVVPFRYWSRIRYYILFDILKNNLTDWKINFFYSVCWREEGMKLENCPKHWFKKWQEIDRNFLYFTDEEKNWFTKEVIDLLKNNDFNKWKEADIFDFDWINYCETNNIKIENDLKTKITYLQKNRKNIYAFLRNKGHYPFPSYYWFHFKIVRILNFFHIYQIMHKIFKKKSYE